ncbi:glycosyltransferase family 4 protein [Winogradskyella sediminis]|uniref:glycosyltransferase family 4 protein n=1 Tax=Winogradskyella sediminis TaxID=1382466 RepID=UPI003AA86848
MIITWIIPDTYGFLVDELEELATRNVTIRVLTGKPIPEQVIERLPTVSFYYCKNQSLVLASLYNRLFDPLWQFYKWKLPLYRYHTEPIAGVYKILEKLEAEQPSDIIHSHFAYPGGIGGTLLKQVPQILTLRGYDILTTGNYGSLWNFFFRQNLINSYAKQGVITGGSQFTVNRTRQILGADANIKWVKQGLAATTFEVAKVHTKASLNIKIEDTVLLAVGNLVEVKNYKLLLQVIAKFPESIKSHLKLVICGDGPLRQALENQSQALGISENVMFMGRLNRSELTDVFELADIFVHSSMSEGFGNVILEAMLFKLLVVASPVGVAADIIQHQKNGFLPDLGDKDSWLKSLMRAISQKDKFKEVLKTNRDLVLNEFGMDKRIDAFLNLYNEVIVNHKDIHLE